VAQANPGLGLNGYCVAVATENAVPILNGESGFTVTDGAVVSDAAFTNSSSTTLDDFYCVVVESALDASSVEVAWNFTDSGGGASGSATLTLDVVVVVLDGTDGFVASPAVVCTSGWDERILTGAASNVPPGPPDPLNQVVNADWTTTPGAPAVNVLGAAFPNGSEWCVNLGASAEQLDVAVTLDFVSVRNRSSDPDDSAHQVATTVNIFADPGFSELRHVTAGGQTLAEQQPALNVLGAIHHACVLPSDADDRLAPNDITFSGPLPSRLRVFHAGDSPDDEFEGVEDGTLCFGWTARDPGLQRISLTFEKATAPGVFETQPAFWDTNGDGNEGMLGDPALLKEWAEFDRTEITSSEDLATALLTNTTITNQTIAQTLTFNVADGTYLMGGGITIYEWTLGAGDRPLDGVVLNARITSACGLFAHSDGSPLLGSEAKAVSGVSQSGRFDRISSASGEPAGDGPDDFVITTLKDPGCRPGQTIRLKIDASHPAGAAGKAEFFETEFLQINLLAQATQPRSSSPQVTWVGGVVSITFGFAVSGTCGDAGSAITFLRSAGPGNFLPHPVLTFNGSDSLVGTFGDACTRTVEYTSEDQGDGTIEVFLHGNPFSKVVLPVFFLAIEDVAATADPQLFVSERGDVSAVLRGWFTQSNPSGRPAETKPDGRALPADRWILPDDWSVLRADQPSWPSSAPLPLTEVTFFMENEAVVNSYQQGVKDGGLGWFLLDGTESNFNVNPRTGDVSVLGSVARPRILTDATDPGGLATVDSFGDLNLSYEGCAPNPPTGNPHCAFEDLAGFTRYFAIADVPYAFGKWPPVRSNTVVTEWLWAGHRRVSIVDHTNPTLKYVVAHLRDRDGFCDAVGFNNALGVEVEFLIDGGPGRFVEASSAPSFISENATKATATTFDILDNGGVPVHQDLAQPSFADDECQAWVLVANSTQEPTNVLVTFPPTPEQVPAQVVITELICSLPESVTVQNVDDHAVSLAGFGIESRPVNPLDAREHLGLDGLLQPGQSATFLGGPNTNLHGWLNNSVDRIFQTPPDFADVVWNGSVLSTADCLGNLSGLIGQPPLPDSSEGVTILDAVVARDDSVVMMPLAIGWNLITVPNTTPIDDVIASRLADVRSVYSIDPVTGLWQRYIPGLPVFVSDLVMFEAGRAYWIEAKVPFTLPLPQ